MGVSEWAFRAALAIMLHRLCNTAEVKTREKRSWLDDVSGPGKPWTGAAVAVSIIGILLLLLGLGTRPDTELLPGYVLVYALIGLLMFGPGIREASWSQLLAFVLPGFAMVALWALGTGYWGGLWLLGLPAWAIICRHWRSYDRGQQSGRLAVFLLLLVTSSFIFVVYGFLPIFGSVLLAVVPAVPLALFIASPVYRRRPLRAATEFLLSCAVVVVALTLPELGWTSPVGFASAGVLLGLLMAGWAGRSPSDSTNQPQSPRPQGQTR